MRHEACMRREGLMKSAPRRTRNDADAEDVVLMLLDRCRSTRVCEGLMKSAQRRTRNDADAEDVVVYVCVYSVPCNTLCFIHFE